MPAGILMAFFPDDVKSRSAPDTKPQGEKGEQEEKNGDQKKEKELHVDTKDLEKSGGFLSDAKDFFPCLLRMFNCKLFTTLLIMGMIDGFAIRGYSMFLPKFFNRYYGLSQSSSSMMFGFVDSLPYAIGNLVGPIIMKHWRMDGRKAVLFISGLSLLIILVSTSRLALQCHSVVNSVGKMREEMEFNFTRECNKDCGCDVIEDPLFPVCARDGHPFFSPCAAGCRGAGQDRPQVGLVFSNCSCAVDKGEVSREWCNEDCRTPMIIFFLLMATASFLRGCYSVPLALLIMRSVPEDLRSQAFAISSFCRGTFAALPSPIAYGAVIDGTCLIWSKHCGQKGACSVYSATPFFRRIIFLKSGLQFLGLLFNACCWFFAKDLVLTEPHSRKSKEAKEIALEEIPKCD